MKRADDGGAWPWLDGVASGAVRATSADAAVSSLPDGRLRIEVGAAAPFTLATPLARADDARLAAFRFERSACGRVESAAVLPDRAAAVVAWTGTDARPFPLCAHVPAPVSVLLLEPTRLVLRTGESHGLVVAADVPVEWRIEATDGALDVHVEASAPLRFVFAPSDAAGGIEGTIDAVVRDATLADRIIAAASGRRRAAGLALELRPRPLSDAFEWARAFVSALPGDTPVAESVWRIPALLAAGDADGARTRLGWLPPPADAVDAAAYVFAHARFAAWSGATEAALERRTDLVRALDALAAVAGSDTALAGIASNGTSSASGAAIILAAAQEGARLAESIDRARAATLASCARRARATFEAAVRSPGFVVDEDAGLARALGLTDADLRPEASDVYGALLQSWGALETGTVRVGGAGLLRAAQAFLLDLARGSPAPRAASALCQATVSGLLGVAPDAVRDRIVLRPRVAPDLLPLAARSIRVGDAAFDLAITDDAGCWALDVEQTAGAVPLQVVLEPWCGAPAFREVRLDGRPADLAARPLDGGWVFPVQLAADRPRRIEVVPDARAGPP